MGNDIVGSKVFPDPEVTGIPVPSPNSSRGELVTSHPEVPVAGVVTRSQIRKQAQEVDLTDTGVGTVLWKDQTPHSGDTAAAVKPLTLTREALVEAQTSDPSLAKCLAATVENPECNEKQPYFVNNGFLMRRWVPHSGCTGTDYDWGTIYQVVVTSN